MKIIGKVLSILLIITCVLTLLPTRVYAAGSYSAYVNSKTITVGKSTNLVITTKNAAGTFKVTSSNSAVAKVSRASTWVDGKMDNAITIKGLKEGTATITITPTNVSDNDYNLLTNKKTIKITVKKASTTTTKPTTTTTTKKLSDATLKSLTTDLAEINFKSDTTKYTIGVDKTVTTLGLVAKANSSKATVKVTGDSDFVIGNNTVTVKVTAEDGTVKNYEILVVKSKYGSGPLTSLKVKNYELNKEFDPGELAYYISAKDVTELEIEYTKAKETTKVEIVGNDNLKEGKNTIKVIAITEKGVSTVYTIDVNVTTSTTGATVVEQNNVMWLIIIIILVTLVILESVYIVIKDKIKVKQEVKTEEASETVIEEVKPKAGRKKSTKKE